MKGSAVQVPQERLRLSPAPAAELAAAAMEARADAGLEAQQGDFVVVAVPAGESDVALAAIERAIADA